MDLKIQGRIIAVLPEVGGISKAGNQWKKQEYVLETFDQYPKKICFNAFGNKVDEFAIQEGETLTVSVDIESREFNGRWYTDIRAWRVERGADPLWALWMDMAMPKGSRVEPPHSHKHSK